MVLDELSEVFFRILRQVLGQKRSLFNQALIVVHQKSENGPVYSSVLRPELVARLVLDVKVDQPVVAEFGCLVVGELAELLDYRVLCSHQPDVELVLRGKVGVHLLEK